MKVLKKLLLAFIISAIAATLNYYEIWIPHDKLTGKGMLMNSSEDWWISFFVWGILLFFIFNGNILFRRKSKEPTLNEPKDGRRF